MSEPEITVTTPRYYVPIQLLGLDDQGRQLYQCPGGGCGETGYFDEHGVGHCPSCEPMQQRINELLTEGLQTLLDEQQ